MPYCQRRARPSSASSARFQPELGAPQGEATVPYYGYGDGVVRA